MIQMIAGVFGLPIKKDGKTIRIKGMGPNDGPFSVSPEREAELVAKGIARYVDHPTVDTALNGDDSVDTTAPIGFDETPPANIEDDDAPKPLEDLSRDELRGVCKEYGLPYKATDSKAKLIEIIVEFQNSAANTEGEDAPTFDPAEAVE